MTRHRYNPTPTTNSSTVHPVHSVHLVHLLALLILATGFVACGHGASKEEETAEAKKSTRDLPLDPVTQSDGQPDAHVEILNDGTSPGSPWTSLMTDGLGKVTWDSIDSRTIENETIVAEDIATGAVTTDEIINNTISQEDLVAGSINSRVVEDETISNWVSVGAVTADGVRISDYSPPPALSRRSIEGAFTFSEWDYIETANIGDLGVTNAKIAPNAIIPLDELDRREAPLDPNESPVLTFTESTPPIVENNFRSATTTPFSTFSIDVDAASYSNVRGFINRGQAPPAAMVRIEELVNYFTYDYPEPTDRHPFAFATEVAPCPWNPENRLVRVALQGKRVDEQELPPSNLVFLIDVSGSMNRTDKLPLLKKSFASLIDRIRPEDRVAIVVYAGAAGLVLESTSGREKGRIRKSLEGLKSGGSTAGGAGIRLAYDVAKKNFIENGNNRVILATDGDFNVGVSDQEGLVTLIEEKREEGIFLSVLGFGHGDYQDAKMEQLADNGNGNYYYIDRIEEGERVFGEGLAGTLLTIAKDVKLQIRFNPEHVAAYRLIGYENRTMAARDFANDRKDAGELGAGHSVTAFYEVIPVGTDPRVEIDTTASADYHLEDAPPNLFTANDILLARLRYKEPEDTVSSLIEHLVRDEPKKIDEVDDDFRFAAAVAAWGMLLRGSAYAGSATSAEVIALAESGNGSDRDGFRAEFVGLVEKWRKEVERVALK